ncbi:response regulator [Salinimonas marina]|uniref:Response regulator n=1 Tax=Salinimonas marina TaxID=2785918 RepID=A0A7S9DUX8_9ALTE|nr:response regulator [Salinimonas marina]QPG04322.1 response regulator [Salinimonas marina]
MQYRLAIVEDNATARGTLRSHVLSLGLFDISSFSSGKELKQALRKQNFEMIILDYHLGEDRTGVEWLTMLRNEQFIRPSTGIIFITSDRLPQTIGQIIDCQPDLLLIKPYNMNSLSRGLKHYINYRQLVNNALSSIDNNDKGHALGQLQTLLQGAVPQRLRNDVIKLKAQLLFETGNIPRARSLYDAILLESDKVLWAQWGKVKCHYIEGSWFDCETELSSMSESPLARGKAFEWLAGLSFEQEAYAQAEQYLDHIHGSELSLSAARLKSMTYQKQHRVVEGIELLQKKREASQHTRDRFTAFTFELAEFYLSIAEQQPVTNRTESLAQARRLIGIAGRAQNDAQLLQKRDILMAYTAILDEEPDRARTLLDKQSDANYQRTSTGTLITAAKVFGGLNQPQKARELLALAHERNQANLSLTEQITHQQQLTQTEQIMGLAAEQASELNEQGTRLFVQREYTKAMYYFYQAYKLLPDTAAFGLNLLQCMLQAGQPAFRGVTLLALMASLTSTTLSASNRSRLLKLEQALNDDEALYLSARSIQRNQHRANA